MNDLLLLQDHVRDPAAADDGGVLHHAGPRPPGQPRLRPLLQGQARIFLLEMQKKY